MVVVPQVVGANRQEEKLGMVKLVLAINVNLPLPWHLS